MQQAKKITGEIVIPQKVIDSVQGKVKDIASFKKTVEENADKNTTELNLYYRYEEGYIVVAEDEILAI